MNDLPKLATPQMQDALIFFKGTIKPLLSDFEYKEVEAKCEQFKHDASLLDERLKKHINSLEGNKSWLLPLWNKMYLSIRGSLLTESNYAFHLTPFDKENEGGVEFMANFIINAALFYKKIYENKLETLNLGKFSFCLELANNLLACQRVAHSELDSWVKYEDFLSCIAINYKQNIYLVTLFDEQKNIIDKEALINILKDIKKADQGYNFYPAGYLGSKKAAKFLSSFLEINNNLELFNSLSKTIFHLSLAGKDFEGEKDFLSLAIKNQNNDIWPYKPVNFIFWDNKQISLHMEHTGADGLYTVYIMEEIIKAYKEERDLSSSYKGKSLALNFSYDEHTKHKLARFKKKFAKISEEYKGRSYIFDHDFSHFKSASADAIAQIALQYGMLALEKRPHCIYSACSMNHFYHGRTEALYTVSEEIQSFIKEIEKNQNFDEKLFEAALNEHKRRIKIAKKGDSFARYFFGLKAFVKDEDLAYFFDSRALKIMNENYFSTSTVGAIGSCIKYFFFTPPNPSTYGVGYLVSKEKIEFDVIYLKENEAKAKLFFEKLDEFKAILKKLDR